MMFYLLTILTKISLAPSRTDTKCRYPWFPFVYFLYKQ